MSTAEKRVKKKTTKLTIGQIAHRAVLTTYRAPTQFKYRVDIFWSVEDEAYVATVPELAGCSTHGDTYVNAAINAQDAIAIYLESLQARGIAAPQPMAERHFSGKIPLRLDPALHRDLTLEAEREHTSLNKLIQKKLQR